MNRKCHFGVPKAVSVADSPCPHWANDIAVGSIGASVAEEIIKLKTPQLRTLRRLLNGNATRSLRRLISDFVHRLNFHKELHCFAAWYVLFPS